MEIGPQFKVLSEGMVEWEIKPTAPGYKASDLSTAEHYPQQKVVAIFDATCPKFNQHFYIHLGHCIPNTTSYVKSHLLETVMDRLRDKMKPNMPLKLLELGDIKTHGLFSEKLMKMTKFCVRCVFILRRY